MGRKSEKRKIGRYEYEVTQLGSEKGDEVLVRVLQLATPILSKLVGARGASSAEDAMRMLNPTALGDVLEQVGRSLKIEDVRYFCDAFGPLTRVTLEGGEGGQAKRVFLDDRVRDDLFAGEYLEKAQWIGFALEVNFRSFFKGAMLVGGSGASPEGNG